MIGTPTARIDRPRPMTVCTVERPWPEDGATPGSAGTVLTTQFPHTDQGHRDAPIGGSVRFR
jgi:hypothetical protein